MTTIIKLISELALVFLRKVPTRGVRFKLPGSMPHARWMSKVIYSLKTWLFRSQFYLTKKGERGLRDTSLVCRTQQSNWRLKNSDGQDIGGFGGENREGSIYPRKAVRRLLGESSPPLPLPQEIKRPPAVGNEGVEFGTERNCPSQSRFFKNSIGKDNVRYSAALSSQIGD